MVDSIGAVTRKHDEMTIANNLYVYGHVRIVSIKSNAAFNWFDRFWMFSVLGQFDFVVDVGGSYWLEVKPIAFYRNARHTTMPKHEIPLLVEVYVNLVAIVILS